MANKSFVVMSVAILFFLLIGCQLLPNNPLFWLATSSAKMVIIRLFLIIVLGLLLLSRPSTSFLQACLVVIGLGLLSLALYQTYQETIQLLDGLSIALAGSSIAMAGLEPAYSEEPLYRPYEASSIGLTWQYLIRRAVNAVMVMFIVARLLQQKLSAGHRLRQISA